MGTGIHVHPEEVTSAASSLGDNNELLNIKSAVVTVGSMLDDLPGSQALAGWPEAASAVEAAVARFRTGSSSIASRLRRCAVTYETTDHEVGGSFNRIPV